MKWPFLLLAAVAVAGGCTQRAPKSLALCTQEAGITGQYSTTYTMGEGRVVNPGPNVTVDQALVANRCLKRLGSETGGTPGRLALRKSSTLPTEYPLLPGDASLWHSMTAEQQLRALEFLRDGSTIRSSLQPD